MIARPGGFATTTEIESRMTEAARVFDWPSVSELAAMYARSLRAATTTPQPYVARVLDLLRKSRRYDALMEVADAALAGRQDVARSVEAIRTGFGRPGQNGRRARCLYPRF